MWFTDHRKRKVLGKVICRQGRGFEIDARLSVEESLGRYWIIASCLRLATDAEVLVEMFQQ